MPVSLRKPHECKRQYRIERRLSSDHLRAAGRPGIVTTNSPPDWAALFRSRVDWEGGNSDLDALEVYDNVCEAFADVI